MLVLSTNMQVPGAFDSIRVEVLSYGSVQFSNDYRVGQGNLRLPATLGIVAGSDPSHPATIRVLSSKNRQVRTLREIVTTVPSDRLATLEVPIEWLCLDRVSTDSAGVVSSSCVGGDTCVAGACVTTDVDSSGLDNYLAGMVFGGGDGTGIGTCFDTVQCFASGKEVEVDKGNCSIASVASTSPGTDVSVALVVPSGAEGICGSGACWVPLDANSEFGWTLDGARIRLPKVACEQLAANKARGIAVTTACASKTSSLPTCGDWSSVTLDRGKADAGAPQGIGGAGTLPTGGTANVYVTSSRGGTTASGMTGRGGDAFNGGAPMSSSATGGVSATTRSYTGGTPAFGGTTAIIRATGTGGAAALGGNPSTGGNSSTGGTSSYPEFATNRMDGAAFGVLSQPDEFPDAGQMRA